MLRQTNFFTTEELEKIQQLRHKLRDLELGEDQLSDHYLIRWLRARSLHLGKAEEMLRKSLQWRAENEVDTILETSKSLQIILKRFDFGNLGIDPASESPVLLLLLGRYNIAKGLEELGEEQLIHATIYRMEYIQKVILKECSEKAGRPVTSFIQLGDLDFYNYRQFANSGCRNHLIKINSMLEANYPEIISNFSLINAPKIFSVLFNLLKVFISKETLAKVAIYGHTNWQDDIRKRFPLELLPPKWGGTRQGRDEFCSGDPIWVFGQEENYFEHEKMIWIEVKARDQVDLEFKVLEEGSAISWKFKSDRHDIGFGIFHEGIAVLAIKRIDAHNKMQIGKYDCEEIGRYRIVFDNSYSYVRSKQVHYTIDVVPPWPTAAVK